MQTNKKVNFLISKSVAGLQKWQFKIYLKYSRIYIAPVGGNQVSHEFALLDAKGLGLAELCLSS